MTNEIEILDEIGFLNLLNISETGDDKNNLSGRAVLLD